jgi:hypothetical protein
MARHGAAVLGLLVQLFVLLEVGPSADGSAAEGPPAARLPASLLAARGARLSLAEHLRGGRGGLDATPPLLVTPGLDAGDDDETEELVVNSPVEQVLPPPGAEPPREPGTAERAPIDSARTHAPGLRAWGRPGPGAPQGPFPRIHLASRPGTPGPALRSAARGPEQQVSRSFELPLSLDERIQQVETTMSDRASDWAKRVRALKELQAIMKSLAPPDACTGDPRAGVLQRMLPGKHSEKCSPWCLYLLHLVGL